MLPIRQRRHHCQQFLSLPEDSVQSPKNLDEHIEFLIHHVSFVKRLDERLNLYDLNCEKSETWRGRVWAFFIFFTLSVFALLLVLSSISVIRVLTAVKEMHTRSHRNQISKALGSKLLSIVEFLYSPKTVEETFRQIVADWREEYFEALKQGRSRKARWISIRYIYSFILAMGLNKVYALFKSVRQVGK
jgi:uncharacterized membrane protein